MSEIDAGSPLAVRLDPETKGRLRALGKLRDRSANYLATAAIKRYLDEEEEYERQKREDMARWERYIATGIVIPGEKVEAWLEEMLKQGKYVEWHE